MKFPNFYFKRRKRPAYLRCKLSNNDEMSVKTIEGLTFQNGTPTIYNPCELISKNSHGYELKGTTGYVDTLTIYPDKKILTQKTGKIIFTGDESDWSLLNFEGNELIYCILDDGLNVTTRDIFFMCSHAQVTIAPSDTVNDRGTIIDGSSVAFQPTFIFEQGEFGTVAAWKEFLKQQQQHEAGTPITIVYALAEPITIEF